MQEQETTVTLQEDVDTPFVRGKRATRAEKLGEPRRRKKKRLDGQASAAEPEAAVPGQKEYEDPSAYTLEKDPRFLDAASSKPKLRQMVATRLEAGSIDTGFQKQLRQQHDMVRELMAKRAQNAKAQDPAVVDPAKEAWVVCTSKLRPEILSEKLDAAFSKT